MLLSKHHAMLVSLLTVMSTSAMAEWVEVGTSDTDTLYFDPAIRLSDNNTFKLWALKDFKMSQRLNELESVKSAKVEYEYDCKAQQARMLYYTSYSESMAGCDIVDFNVAPSDWVLISANSGNELLWKIACGKA